MFHAYDIFPCMISLTHLFQVSIIVFFLGCNFLSAGPKNWRNRFSMFPCKNCCSRLLLSIQTTMFLEETKASFLFLIYCHLFFTHNTTLGCINPGLYYTPAMCLTGTAHTNVHRTHTDSTACLPLSDDITLSTGSSSNDAAMILNFMFSQCT